MKIYVLIAFFTVATMGLSNASVGYLNYPTQVLLHFLFFYTFIFCSSGDFQMLQTNSRADWWHFDTREAIRVAGCYCGLSHEFG